MNKKLSFEQAMIELDEKVKSLETGNLSLEESLDVFADAVKLIKTCNAKLSSAKEKARILIENEDGSVTDAPFDNSEDL